MTAPQADGADRISGAAKSLLRPSTALSGLAILLLVGLVIRLTLAYVLLPRSGFESDIGTFTAWALNLAEHGPGSFYATTTFADYPPGYLYLLWLIGGLGHLLAPLANTDPASATGALIKLPAIFADVLVGLLLYRVVRSWRAPRLDAHRLGLIAAALYLFNPVTWYDSAVWGQVDSISGFLMLGSLTLLVLRRDVASSAAAAAAVLVKPQAVIVMLVVGAVLVRRHAIRKQHPWVLLADPAAAVSTLTLVAAPFDVGLFAPDRLKGVPVLNELGGLFGLSRRPPRASPS